MADTEITKEQAQIAEENSDVLEALAELPADKSVMIKAYLDGFETGKLLTETATA